MLSKHSCTNLRSTSIRSGPRKNLEPSKKGKPNVSVPSPLPAPHILTMIVYSLQVPEAFPWPPTQHCRADQCLIRPLRCLPRRFVIDVVYPFRLASIKPLFQA